MGLNGEKMLQSLKHLSQVDKMKQVEPMSYALFPGYHCPLMGAMLTIRAIKDSVMLVLGPDECAYYTKMATSGNGSMSADGCQIVSVVLEQHDVTFGCQEKLEEAMEELNDEYHPKAVFIVTTCVPEITGDDVESMADLFTDQYGFPVMVVHAENFKTDDHLPGIEHTLEVCCAMMQPQEKTDCVNVLGLRLGDFTKTEVYRVLQEQSIPVGMQLPGNSSAEEIERAPQAAVNLVVHPVGLALAKKMKRKFGTPYIVFERYSDPDRIYQSYKELFEILEKPLPEKLAGWYQEAKKRSEAAKPILNGPKGIGVLYAKTGVFLTNLIEGGGQERGKRAGTENLPAIVGMVAALEEACSLQKERSIYVTKLRDQLIDGLKKIPGALLNGDATNRLPGNVNFCFPDTEAEGLLLLLDNKGICASSGSACTSGFLDPSHVLLAIGRDPQTARGSLRLTLDYENTPEEVETIIEAVTDTVRILRGC